MIELGVSPPPRFEQKSFVAGGMLTYMLQLDIWLRALRDRFAKVATYSKVINPAVVNANTTREQTFTVTGLSTTDIVCVNKPSHQAGMALVGFRVSAKNTIALTFMNATAGNIDPVSETYTIIAIRK